MRKSKVKASASAWIRPYHCVQVSLLYVTENPQFIIWATCEQRDDSVKSSMLSESVNSCKSLDLLSKPIAS